MCPDARTVRFSRAGSLRGSEAFARISPGFKSVVCSVGISGLGGASS